MPAESLFQPSRYFGYPERRFEGSLGSRNPGFIGTSYSYVPALKRVSKIRVRSMSVISKLFLSENRRLQAVGLHVGRPSLPISVGAGRGRHEAAMLRRLHLHPARGKIWVRLQRVSTAQRNPFMRTLSQSFVRIPKVSLLWQMLVQCQLKFSENFVILL